MVLSYLATFQKSVNDRYNMRRWSQYLDDIVINPKKIFQSKFCEIWRYLHQTFLPAYHLPESP
ncbi:hypothetical protein XT66_04105 [Salmonella enterica subsp. salamae]|uniref:Reverse transcriptase n=1 Tax=Salmonella enterica subsp. salamae TaxID=59202 RepID=A0A6C8Y7C6_SALER|nr:hypothetical protein [Salmonella enterica subsp. salamae]MII77696.1 hypothetical protein [Salmonella enterica subsp. salamae]HAC6698581.1 hypothetical protein [Salmonella bongori serovar 66:z65:-]